MIIILMINIRMIKIVMIIIIMIMREGERAVTLDVREHAGLNPGISNP